MNAFTHKVKYAFVKAGIAGDDNPAQNKPTRKKGWGDLQGFSDSISLHHLSLLSWVVASLPGRLSSSVEEQAQHPDILTLTTSAQRPWFPVALAKTPGLKQPGWAWTYSNHWTIQPESREGGSLKEKRHFFPESEKKGRWKQQIFTLEGIFVVDICYPFWLPNIWTRSLYWRIPPF